MKLRIIGLVVLVALIAGLLWLTFDLKADYQAAMEQYAREVELLEQAQEKINLARQELDALNTDEADARDAAADQMHGEAAAMEQQTKRILAQIQEILGEDAP